MRQARLSVETFVPGREQVATVSSARNIRWLDWHQRVA